MPLLHTWSLAVEEQFYLIMPLFLVRRFQFICASRSPPPSHCNPVYVWKPGCEHIWSRRISRCSVLLFTVTSLGALIGSILALIPAGWILSNRLARETITYAGLTCIVAPCLFYTKDTPFPGLAAVVPCAGTAAIIWANTIGSSGMSLTTAGALLAWRPLVFLGLISYSLYLWHWPLLVFSNYWSLGPLSLSSRLGLLVLALLLAILSWRFVETPIRHRAIFPARSSLFSFAVLFVLTVFALASFVIFTLGYPSRLPAQALLYAQAERDQARHYNRKTKDIRVTPFRISVQLMRARLCCFGATLKHIVSYLPSIFWVRI
jgi:Predicted acyltransferases